MRISEILKESEEQTQSSNDVPLSSAIDSIQSAIEKSLKMIQSDPKKLMALAAKQDGQVDEAGFKSALASIAIAGLGALSALPSQAQENIGQNLAQCSGQFGMLEQLSKMGGDANTAQAMKTAEQRALKLSASLIGQQQANSLYSQEFAKISKRMSQGDPNAIKDVNKNMEYCAKAMRYVELEAEKAQSKPATQAQSVSAQQATTTLGEVRKQFYSELGALAAYAQLNRSIPDTDKQNILAYVNKYKDGIANNKASFDTNYKWASEHYAATEKLNPAKIGKLTEKAVQISDWIESMKSAIKSQDSRAMSKLNDSAPLGGD